MFGRIGLVALLYFALFTSPLSPFTLFAMGQLKVRKPKAIVFDIAGTVTKSNFFDHVLFPYVTDNVKVYLDNNWSKPVLIRDIEMLRAESKKDGPEIVGPNEPGSKVRQSVADYVRRCQEELRNHEAIRIFR